MAFYFLIHILATSTLVNAKEVCFKGNIHNDNLELTNTYGTLQSPQQDSNGRTEYPPDMNWDWVITVPASKIVRLSFDRFDLEWSSDCTADYVEVKDGNSGYSRSKGRFCGSEIPEDVLSTGRYMHVRFRSDSKYSYYLGFKATFTAEDKSSKCRMQNVDRNNQQTVHAYDQLLKKNSILIDHGVEFPQNLRCYVSGSITRYFGFINWIDNVNRPP